MAGLVAAASGVALAGGNLQFRNPSNLSEVFNEVRDPRQLPVTWVMSEDGLPGSGLSNATLVAALTAAFDAWQSLPTSSIAFQFGGEVPVRRSGLGGPLGAGIDGRNLVTFTDPNVVFPSGGELAVAITFSFPTETVVNATNHDLDGDGTQDLPDGTYPPGTIFDADIVFNSSDHLSVTGANGTQDIQAIAMHEVGHSIGLCHSMTRDAVMWPFLANNVASARTLKPDDVAYASFFYPAQPAYGATFGMVRGRVTNGLTGVGVLGAHVFTVDPGSGAKMVGAYTGDDGRYVIPGVAAGSYLIGIEPLDGDPVGLDPFRINQVVQFTFDTNFPEEFYDADEGAVEADPHAALPVAVTAGADATGIDLVTNTLEVPGVGRTLAAGFNLFAYPVAVPGGLTGLDLLQALGDPTEVNAVDRFVPGTSTFERAQYVGGSPAGAAFPVRRGEGYVVHTAGQKVVSFSGGTDCPDLDLVRGLNLIGVPCPPIGYTAFALLRDLGTSLEVAGIERFDSDTAAYEVAQYDMGGDPTGDDFPVANGEGYIVTMLADKAGIRIPAVGSVFPPVITGLSPGRGVPGTVVLVLGGNFDPDPTRDLVTFNGVPAGVIFATATSLTVTVPAGATSGPVRVTVAGRASNAVDFVVEPAAVNESGEGETELVSGQTATGMLGADGEQDRYVFTALAGSVVTVTAESVTPGVPDLVLLLEDPFGLIVASDDNGGGGTNPRINNFELTTTGTHTIVVSNVPGSGTGAYHVTLTIQTRSTAPRISIIGGNYQTGMAGSQLPIPLAVFVTGATGAAVSHAAVTFVATSGTIGGSSVTPINAGTTVIATNASGIVTVDTTLAGTPGQYTITVTADGVAPVTFTIAATNSSIGSVTMLPANPQSGTVGEQLPAALTIVVRDTTGALVPGVPIAFQVAAGGGTVTDGGVESAQAIVTTDASGTAQTLFRLGQKTSDAQIVAAAVPAMSTPLFFEGIPEAGNPANVHSNISNFNRLTLGTSRLNALEIEVTDQFDNPVPDVLVGYTAPGGLTVAPGLGPEGKMFTDFRTDEHGVNVAMVTAEESGMPTVDEFGGSIGGPLTITANVPGTPGQSYNIDVDMGPTMVTGSTQNDGALIGQMLPGPVQKLVLRYQRRDRFVDANNDMRDDDNCEFTDEMFGSVPLDRFAVSGILVAFEVEREDGKKETDFGLQATHTAAMSAPTDGTGRATTAVTLGDVGGVSNVIGTIASMHVTWRANGPGCDGAVLHDMTLTDSSGQDYGESTNVFAIPVVVKTTIGDVGSGIDFSTLRGMLNGMVFFDGMSPPLTPQVFPEKLELTIGGRVVQNLPANVVTDSAFPSVVVEYHPSRPKLTGSNTVAFQTVRDRIQNQQVAPAMTTFTYP